MASPCPPVGHHHARWLPELLLSGYLQPVVQELHRVLGSLLVLVERTLSALQPVEAIGHLIRRAPAASELRGGARAGSWRWHGSCGWSLLLLLLLLRLLLLLLLLLSLISLLLFRVSLLLMLLGLIFLLFLNTEPFSNMVFQARSY